MVESSHKLTCPDHYEPFSIFRKTDLKLLCGVCALEENFKKEEVVPLVKYC